MNRHPLLASTLVVLALAAPGCAKRPSMTGASAPAPTAPATSSVASSAPNPSKAQEPTGPASKSEVPARAAAPRPAPSEFGPVPEVADVYFDFDKYEIRPADAKILDASGRWLKTNAGHAVLIEGHADERGTPEYNLTLSERRARAALNYLTTQGVAASRMTIIGYGESRPVCKESAEPCWAKNRRAHFLVKPQ